MYNEHLNLQMSLAFHACKTQKYFKTCSLVNATCIDKGACFKVSLASETHDTTTNRHILRERFLCSEESAQAT